jgi:hypothetical protein
MRPLSEEVRPPGAPPVLPSRLSPDTHTSSLLVPSPHHHLIISLPPLPHPHPQETKAVFEKLYKFIGKDIKSLIDRPDGQYCFRLHKNRIFYVSESIMKRATNVGGLDLVGMELFIRGGKEKAARKERPAVSDLPDHPLRPQTSKPITPLLIPPGRARPAGVPGLLHRQAHALWQVPADDRRARDPGAVCKAQGALLEWMASARTAAAAGRRRSS